MFSRKYFFCKQIYKKYARNNLLFFKTVILLLNENNSDLEQKLKETANLILELSSETKSHFINQESLYKKIKSYSEICYQILFYFVIANSQFTDQQYYECLNNQNILIQDKYSNIDIDIFCLNTLFENSKGEYKLDEMTNQWADFVCKKINDFEEFEGNNLKIQEKTISYINKKIIWMINPYHLFQIMAGINFPKI